MSLANQLEQLLAPVAGDNPAGVYLKEDRASYRPLRNSYNIAQTSFRRLTNNPAAEELDELQQSNQDNWQELSRQLTEVIRERSKDLECISWLALAQLFSRDPYENLTASLQLLAGAVEQFGEQINPRVPDNKLRATDDAGRRAERAGLQLRPVSQMLGESEESCLLGLPLRMLPLIGNIDYVTWRSAEDQSSRVELQKQARQELAESQQEVIAQVHGINNALQALEQVEQKLAEYAGSCGVPKVSSRFLRAQLSANLNALKSLTEGALVPWPLDVVEAQPAVEPEAESNESAQDPQAAEPAATNTAVTQPAAAHQQPVAEPIYNRDQAFQQLRLIANYFARTEPQSPVSSMIEKVIRWGYTPLPDLINELVQGHDGLMGRIGELTGMNAEKVHIPGTPAQGLVAPPQETPQAPSQQPAQQNSLAPEQFTQEAQLVAETQVKAERPQANPAAEVKQESSEPKPEPKPAKSGIPSFLNLSPKEEKKKPEVKRPSGPGGLDLASLGIG
ncbi:type VI secretion system protein TssA [Spongorhabdus nitratireducens]